MKKKGKILFNAVRLAKMLNVTDRRIRQLAQIGVLEPEPGSRDKDGVKYDIEKNVLLFIEYREEYRKHFTPEPLDDETLNKLYEIAGGFDFEAFLESAEKGYQD